MGEGYATSLKAAVGANPILPPTTGWLFDNWDSEEFEEDASLVCLLSPDSPPCCLTVTLSGAAKEAHGQRAGEYRSIGLTSMGRKVYLIYGQKLISSFLAGIQIGGVG